MRKPTLDGFRSAVAVFALFAGTGPAAPGGDGRPYGRAERWGVPFVRVRLQDTFWAPKQNVYRTRTIPPSWQYVSQAMAHNEIAAGRSSATPEGALPWIQANLHKLLETCAYALGQQADPILNAKVDSLIALIRDTQQPNGYVNATITTRGLTPWTNLDGQHEGYVAGHMIEAAVAHYLATGTSPAAARGTFTNHPAPAALRARADRG